VDPLTLFPFQNRWAEKVGIETGMRVSLQAQPGGKLLIDPLLEGAGS